MAPASCLSGCCRTDVKSKTCKRGVLFCCLVCAAASCMASSGPPRGKLSENSLAYPPAGWLRIWLRIRDKMYPYRGSHGLLRSCSQKKGASACFENVYFACLFFSARGPPLIYYSQSLTDFVQKWYDRITTVSTLYEESRFLFVGKRGEQEK